VKIKVSLCYEVEVDPDNYPSGVDTIEEICEFERHNDLFFETIIWRLEKGEVLIDIQPVR
jgi:hypothetical protein